MTSAFPNVKSSTKAIGLAAAYFGLKFFLKDHSPWMLTLTAMPIILVIASANQRRGIIAGTIVLLINALTTGVGSESGTLPNLFAGLFAVGLGTLSGFLSTKQKTSLSQKVPAAKINREKMLQSILLHTDSVVTLIDRNGQMLFNEGRGLRRIDMADGAMVGETIHKRFAGMDNLFDAFNRALTGETVLVNYGDDTWENGVYIVTYLPVHDDDGTINQVLAISQDVTETRRAQAKINEQRFQISQSARLTSLGEMAAGISHEINNPVMIIYGNAQNLLIAKQKNQLTDEIFSHSVTSIERNCERISKIIRNMKALAVDSDQERPQPADLKTIIEDAADLVQNRMGHKGIRFSVEVPESPAVISVRSTGILQVIVNLLNNAIDAAGGSPSPWIRLHLERGQHQILISVEDSGKKIDPGTKKKMFQPFFSTKATGSGMGLGLSISERIVSSHGGQLILDSDSKNTRFVIQLPDQMVEKLSA